MTLMLDFPEALEAAGVTVRLLDGWDTPAKNGYYWREDDDDPAGHMHHHTASTGYTPNRDKANAYAGLSKDGSDRLYQEDYGDGQFEPVYTIANAYPAPISSGAGDFNVLEKVRQGIEVVGRQGSDTPGWYGNTHYWNTEWILDGTGSPIDQMVWEMMCVVCDVQNDLKLWTPNQHIGHGHHTRRKIDLWGGQFSDTNRDGFDKTIIALREGMGAAMFTHFQIGTEYSEFEEISWLLFMLKGGTVDPNLNSSQVTTALPYKTNVRLAQDEDFDLIAQYTDMSDGTKARFKNDGLYRFGKEIAALREYAFREDN